MIKSNRFANIAKITLLIGAGALMLNACSDKGSSASKKADGKRTSFEQASDRALGSAEAPITVVEYASVTCGHCANWHETVWPELQTKYVDTGKVRYVYREFPTGNVSLANVGHLLANCAGDDQFYNMISVQMERQRQILTAGNKVKDEYLALAKSAGMSEADFDACMANEELTKHLQDVLNGGIDAGVTGTPTFFINGKKEAVYTLEDFDKVFAPILGLPVPKSKDEPAAESDSGSEH